MNHLTMGDLMNIPENCVQVAIDQTLELVLPEKLFGVANFDVTQYHHRAMLDILFTRTDILDKIGFIMTREKAIQTGRISASAPVPAEDSMEAREKHTTQFDVFMSTPNGETKIATITNFQYKEWHHFVYPMEVGSPERQELVDFQKRMGRWAACDYDDSVL